MLIILASFIAIMLYLTVFRDFNLWYFKMDLLTKETIRASIISEYELKHSGYKINLEEITIKGVKSGEERIVTLDEAVEFRYKGGKFKII